MTATRETLIATLQWYLDAGVDEALADEPWNRMAPPAAAPAPMRDAGLPAQGAPSGSPPHRANAPRPGGAPPANAPRPAAAPPVAERVRADLAAATDLAAVRAVLDAFDGCALKATATNTVFGVGPADADLMIIGEAPGEEEDRQGQPFVGPSGKLLDLMLEAIGLEREKVYVTNTLYWRPPGNRTPTPQEVLSCQPFLQRQIELIRPRVLLLVGGAAAKTVLQRSEGIMRLRGKWFDLPSPGGDTTISAMATFHPAYLLRSPAQKREAWQDLLAVKGRLKPISA